MTHLYEACPGQVVVDYGPLRLSISCGQDGQPAHAAAVAGAEAAIRAFEALAEHLRAVGYCTFDDPSASDCPPVLRRMRRAARATGYPALTPMAAVAGAIADVAANAAARRGATKVIVDNAGDIAIRLRGDEVLNVGVATEIGASDCALAVRVDRQSGIGGVATSGLGGRGLTKGVASAAVALCRDGALADACATCLGNAATVDHAAVRRCLAEEIDPNTDIRGHEVVLEAGVLPEDACQETIVSWARQAEGLLRRGVLLGSLVVVQGRYAARGRVFEEWGLDACRSQAST